VSVYLPQLLSMIITYFLHHITLSSVACLTLLYFTTISHKWHNFHKKYLEYKMVFWYSLHQMQRNISHFKMNFIKYYHKSICLHVTYMLFLPYINEMWIFLTEFWISSYIKLHANPFIVSQTVPCRQMDGLTVMMKQMVTFHNLGNMPKNSHHWKLSSTGQYLNNETYDISIHINRFWVLKWGNK
jgi:hypothetical protein